VLVAGSATLDLFDAAIEGTITSPNGTGQGLVVQDNASVELARSVVEQVQGGGVVSSGSAFLSLADVVIRAGVSDATHRHGYGLVAEGAVFDARRLWVTGNREIGVLVDGPVHHDVHDIVVANTDSREADLDEGVGIAVAGGSAGSFERVWLDHNRNAGLRVTLGSTATVADLTVISTLGRRSDGTAQAPLRGSTDAFVRLSRASFVKNTSAGVNCSNGARMVLSDVQISGTVAALPARDGQGILLESGGSLEGARFKIEGGTHAGVDVSDLTTTASISDLSVSGVVAQVGDIDDSGMGLRLASGTSFSASCVMLDTNEGYGVLVASSARVFLEDLTVRGTLPEAGRKAIYGRGIGVQDGSTLTAKRVLVYGTPGASLATIDGFAQQINTASISDANFGRANARQCSGAGCPDTSDALGVHVSPLTNLRLARFSITDAARAGVLIEPGATAQLADGVLASSPIGLLIAPPSAARLSSVTERVLFQGNGINADLPAPPPITHP
jgi:hypothetical protein